VYRGEQSDSGNDRQRKRQYNPKIYRKVICAVYKRRLLQTERQLLEEASHQDKVIRADKIRNDINPKSVVQVEHTDNHKPRNKSAGDIHGQKERYRSEFL
jgi:hypothetical protein